MLNPHQAAVAAAAANTYALMTNAAAAAAANAVTTANGFPTTGTPVTATGRTLLPGGPGPAAGPIGASLGQIEVGPALYSLAS